MIIEKIKNLNELVDIRTKFRSKNKKIVFTNGVFDVLHRGHVEYLEKAKEIGDILILGLNSDSSVRRIKGKPKPIVSQQDRAIILAGLGSVDYICLFEEDTPYNLISKLKPDFLVKGGDYNLNNIVGREIVESYGGKVVTIPLIPDRSTTNIVRKIISLVNEGKLK